jgi:hypothetical protein
MQCDLRPSDNLDNLAPLEEIRPHILRYWKMRMNDKKILQQLREKHIDNSKYGIG